jgi:YHS domain-containing protein
MILVRRHSPAHLPEADRLFAVGTLALAFLASFPPAAFPAESCTDEVLALPSVGRCSGCDDCSCNDCMRACKPHWEDKKTKKPKYSMKCEEECVRGFDRWHKDPCNPESDPPCGHIFVKKKLMKREEDKVERVLKYDIVGGGPEPAQRCSPPACDEAPAKRPNGTVALAPAPPHAPAADPLGPMPVGLDGYCPVTLYEHESWAEGRAQWGARHRGRTYLFASSEQQQLFLADPDRYAPALSGDDPVVALNAERSISGRREFGIIYQSRIYLFASPESRAAFSADPDRYALFVVGAEQSPPAIATVRR